jgi:hypothetical protein
MRRIWLAIVGVLLMLLAYAALGSWVVLSHSREVTRQRFYRLQAVSVGMSRSAVIARLGEPNWTEKDNEFIEGESEVLIYSSSTEVPDDLWVILDRNGRVASVLYPDIGSLAKGEIVIGDAASKRSGRAAMAGGGGWRTR